MSPRIAIVGVGHRGLAILERIVSHAHAGRVQTEVLLVEPHELGVGVHWRDQPDYLILNTVAAQATAFADPAMIPGAPVIGGPTFLQWCRNQGIELAPGQPVGPDDFAARKVWGDYLAWTAERIVAVAPPWASLAIYRGEARQVSPASGGAVVTLDDGTSQVVDLVFVTTGHGVRERAGATAPGCAIDCYPLPDTVADIEPSARVGISGMGLTAVDVVAALTLGRGGAFRGNVANLSYVPSGTEPRIVLFSRTGRFPCARPKQPRAKPKTDALCFTAEALREARQLTEDGRLDFISDVYPLIRQEILTRPLNSDQHRLAEAVLGLHPQTWVTQDAYRHSVIADARFDVHEAALGLEISTFKDAMEVMRDLRERLRDVVRPPGLTLQGHRDFFEHVPALANRAAVGPQLDRVTEILVLIDAGVVELGPGPSPAVRPDGGVWAIESTHLQQPERILVDHLVEAHLAWPRSIGGRDCLRAALRIWAEPHPADSQYLHLTTHGEVFTRDGHVANRIVVLGPPSEGANYYNNYVLWPGAPSSLLGEVDEVLSPIMHCPERQAKR